VIESFFFGGPLALHGSRALPPVAVFLDRAAVGVRACKRCAGL
jgi:hypothetical protein